MLIRVCHTTRYRFPAPPSHGLQRLRLCPKSTHGQKVIDWRMTVEGAEPQLEYDDHNQNHTHLIAFAAGTAEIAITCEGTFETADHAGVIGRHAGFMPLWAFAAPTPITRAGPRLRALATHLKGEDLGAAATMHHLSRLVREAVEYRIGATDSATSAEAALGIGAGVCQDHAHVFIAAARLLGVPARYVSGYLLMDGRTEQEAGHAWAEAHLPVLGWVGFDVSNGISPDERYVRVATGADYRDAAPVTGIAMASGSAELHVQLAVEQQRQEQ
ncbi:MAG: transglutaminase family protein [Proteobacteria bacterium]|nr:transglutaminase family protein [Pseudomonadota bacterium]